MSKPTVEPDVLNVKQVNQFFGGNIGEQVCRKLMQDGSLRSFEYGDSRTLLTTRRECERLRDTLLATPVNNGLIHTYPVLYCLRKAK